MSGTFKGLTQAQIDRRLKEGCGQGQGPDYKPFIYTRDVSPLGRSHRLPGSKTRRLLSQSSVGQMVQEAVALRQT